MMTLLFCFLSSLFPFFLFTVFVPLLVFLSSFYPLALTKHTQTHSTPAISSHLQPLSHGHTHTHSASLTLCHTCTHCHIPACPSLCIPPAASSRSSIRHSLSPCSAYRVELQCAC